MQEGVGVTIVVGSALLGLGGAKESQTPGWFFIPIKNGMSGDGVIGLVERYINRTTAIGYGR
jgi:hypothetical protein